MSIINNSQEVDCIITPLIFQQSIIVWYYLELLPLSDPVSREFLVEICLLIFDNKGYTTFYKLRCERVMF